jgi:hypothetical protein
MIALKIQNSQAAEINGEMPESEIIQTAYVYA